MGPPPHVRKFAGRSRSDLKKILILLGFFDLENFQLMGSPLVSIYARFRAFGPGNSISIIYVLAAEEAISHVDS